MLGGWEARFIGRCLLARARYAREVSGGFKLFGTGWRILSYLSIFARDWASGFRLRWATRKGDAACETPVGG